MDGIGQLGHFHRQATAAHIYTRQASHRTIRFRSYRIRFSIAKPIQNRQGLSKICRFPIQGNVAIILKDTRLLAQKTGRKTIRTILHSRTYSQQMWIIFQKSLLRRKQHTLIIIHKQKYKMSAFLCFFSRRRLEESKMAGREPSLPATNAWDIFRLRLVGDDAYIVPGGCGHPPLRRIPLVYYRSR